MINWIRKTAAQALDFAAETYGALASWCVRTSEQLDPYTQDDYRHARDMIDKAAGAFPRAELRDADHTHFATGGLVHPDGTRMDYDGWHYTGPDGSGINIGRPSGDSHEGRGPSYWLDDALKGDPEPSEQPSGTEERRDGHGDDPATWMRPAAPTVEHRYWFNESDGGGSLTAKAFRWDQPLRFGGEHHYVNGVCSCGWPIGVHPSETDDE